MPDTTPATSSVPPVTSPVGSTPPTTPPVGSPKASPPVEPPKISPSKEEKSVLSDVKKINKPADKKAADKVKTDTPAEKEVIRKIKVGDQEYDENILKQMLEKAKGADKKFLDAAKARKEAMRFFKLAKENPREFLLKTGIDPKKFSYDEVAKDIQDKLRDPREVELEAAKKQLEAFEKREAAQKKSQAEEKLAKEAQALEARFHSEMIEALEATPSIPKNGFSVARIAKYIDTVRDRTGVLLSAKEVVNVIDQDIRAEVSGILKGASAEQIIQLIGTDGAEAIRQYHLKKIKDPLGGNDGAGEASDKPKTKRWKTSHDFWKTIDRAAKDERGE